MTSADLRRRPLDAAAVAAALAAGGLGPDATAGSDAAARVARPGRVVVVPATASTSTDLVEAVTASPDAWPDRSILVADHQQAGRGRSGRTWSTPAGAALTVSFLLRPAVPAGRLGWVPLVAGLAVVRALEDTTGLRAWVKWPNDVLLDDPGHVEVAGWGTRRKVAGVLADLVHVGGAAAVVVGIGVNVAQDQDELPVPSATSVALCGARTGRVKLLVALTRRLLELESRWRAHAGDAEAAGIARECAAVSATLGRVVEVDLPGGERLRGTATGLADDGALLVVDAYGRPRTVLAGDVRLRVAGSGVN